MVTTAACCRKVRLRRQGIIMPQVLVCPLSLVPATVASSGARHLVTLINDSTPVERPAAIVPENHLFLGINDIIEPAEGMVVPALEHVQELVDFVRRWDQAHPIVVHCFAGISRSTAAAFIALCAVNPERREADIAQRLRAASPTATPNSRIVGFGDAILGRKGRMVSAVQSIGRGAMAVEGMPFGIPIRD
jgi:predicted protein tyrosine phosphatase